MAKTVPCVINAYKYSYFWDQLVACWLVCRCFDCLTSRLYLYLYIFSETGRTDVQCSSMGVSLHLMEVVRSIEV